MQQQPPRPVTFDDFWNAERHPDLNPPPSPARQLRQLRRLWRVGFGAVLLAIGLAVFSSKVPLRPTMSPADATASTGETGATGLIVSSETDQSVTIAAVVSADETDLSSTTELTAVASTSTCQAGPILTDSLQPPWYPASWSGTTVDLVDGRHEVTMPQAWSGYSVATSPISVANCENLQFDISSPSPLTLNLSVNDGNNQIAGQRAIQVTPDTATVTIPLSGFTLPNNQITRFTLQNSGTPGAAFVIGNLGFGQATQPEGCASVFVDALDPAWQPASWTVQNLTYGEEISATFPQKWGALSHAVTADPVAIGDCTHLSFTIRASVPDSDFQVRINGSDGSPIDLGEPITVGTSDETISVPLGAAKPSDGLVTRVSIINKADNRGTTIVVDDVRFTTPSDGGGGGDDSGGGGDDDGGGDTTMTFGSGVNLPSAEYVCVHNVAEDGYRPTEIFEHKAFGVSHQQMAQYLKDWGVKTVRIPMNSHCWLGGFDYIYSDLQGQRYRDEVAGLVDALTAEGITSWLELHWTAPAGQEADYPNGFANNYLTDADHAPQFWSSVAARFSGYGDNVIYGPYNEPATDRWFTNPDEAWGCWRDGCQVNGIQYAGMQQLVDAIRGSGSDQVIAIGGLDYSYDFSRWLQYLPSDPQDNLAADIHVYNFKSCNGVDCFDADIAAIAAAGHEVLIGELGQGVEDGTTVCQSDFIEPVMDWADNNDIPYMGWRYNASGGSGACYSTGSGLVNGVMTLVETWDGSQTTPMGEALRQRLGQQ